MENERVPFLVKRVYYENCPGCKNDEKKESNLGLAYKELFYVWICVLATSLTISSLFPYLYFMIRDLHIAERVEDIGFYAGFVAGAAFMCGRAFTSFCWGVVADKWGRKPVIIIGLLSVVVFNTLFGLSTNYWMVISTRFLLGALNGLIGPIKAYASEVTRPEHQSVGLSMVSTAWGIGLIIGPAIGGFLAQPAEKFPSVFTEASLFGRLPYLLPSLCISLFAVVVLITCIWLPETLHNHPVNMFERKIVGKGDEEAGVIHFQENLLENWPLMSAIIVYCVFAFHDMAYIEVFSLWTESDKKFGGLSFSTEDVGEVLAVTGFSLLVCQLLFYPRAERLLGTINLTRLSAALAIPLLAAYPPMTNLSGFTLKLVVNFASLVKNILSMFIVTGTFILQNNAVTQHQRGAANGISTTGESIFRGAAPAVAGIIFSWAQKRQNTSFLPGYEMVFFILGTIELIGLLMTFKPFLAIKS